MAPAMGANWLDGWFGLLNEGEQPECSKNGSSCWDEFGLLHDKAPPAEYPPPSSLERLPLARALLVSWRDGLAAQLPYLALRGQCMCARCVDEITGERIVDLDGLDPHVAIEDLQLVGNYALKIRWTDGHDTGLYTWQHLRQLCQEAAAR